MPVVSVLQRHFSYLSLTQPFFADASRCVCTDVLPPSSFLRMAGLDASSREPKEDNQDI